ncbi:hypothetical protein RJ55_00138 [Drechmeria coniospora]|nr:hypothetical protein RJ55_00138 [Drechmeria coniospora]
MARFLFAIIKQKNLKNVDWNLVASDPVLLEPISNGHAARMRFSRFRATVTVDEARRQHIIDDNNRVSKPLKKRASARRDHVKSESDFCSRLSAYKEFSPVSLGSPRIDTSPFMGNSPYMDDACDSLDRFLSPCSDDVTPAIVAKPVAMDGEGENGSSNLSTIADGSSDLFNAADFLAFDAAYGFGGCGTGSTAFHCQDMPELATAYPVTGDESTEWNRPAEESCLF